MQCEYRFGNREDLPSLRELWKEAFGDGDSFLDQFFSVAFAPEHSRVAVVDGAVGAALYWFFRFLRGAAPGLFLWCGDGRPASGQGTVPRSDGRYPGASGGRWVWRHPPGAWRCPLFRFYGRLGYTPCCPQGRMRVRAAGPALPLKPVSPRRYGGAPAGLPPGGVRQEGVSLEFQASLAWLYAGKDLLLTAARQEDGAIQALELLCRDPIAAAPRILKALRAEEGVFRVPYAKGRPFAMFLPLASWQGPPPCLFWAGV